MNLNYKILWFEDDEDIISEDVAPQIEEYLKGLGFVPEIFHYFNGENLDSLIEKKNYDLIVTDLNLGEYETGAQLIDHIREGNILTEVLLYSANANEINAIVDEKGWIERASFSVGLKNLPDKLKKVIYLTIRKTQDVNNTRGLIIAETIYLENKIEEILSEFFKVSAETVLDPQKLELLKNIYDKRIENHKIESEILQSIDYTDLNALIDNDILSAANSFDALQSILKSSIKSLGNEIGIRGIEKNKRLELEIQMERIKELKATLNGFKEEIFKIRNTLAHVVEEIDEDGTPFLKSINKRDGTTIRFTDEKYIELRSTFKRHKENLMDIYKHLVSS
jgi:CheY-like chemotaxis protein